MKVLVTGAAGGLGSRLCEHLLNNNHHVVGTYRREDQIGDKSFAKNDKFKGIELDLINVVSAESCNALITDDIDHVVFCHGMNFNKDILTLERNDIIFSHQVNFISAFLISQQVVQNWIKNSSKKDRSLVYIGSAATKGGSPDELAYHSAKRASESVMLSFARGFAEHNIRANVVSPGLMDTKMGQQTLEQRPDVFDRIPLKKLVGVDEVVRLIDTILHSPSITGQNFHINNGRYVSI